MEKAAAWSVKCEAQAARAEALTAEVAAGVARLGERREVWAAWRAWRRGSQQRSHERRRAVLRVTAMVSSGSHTRTCGAACDEAGGSSSGEALSKQNVQSRFDGNAIRVA